MSKKIEATRNRHFSIIYNIRILRRLLAFKNFFANLCQKCAKVAFPIGIVVKGVKTPLPAVREGGETLGAYTIPEENRQTSV